MKVPFAACHLLFAICALAGCYSRVPRDLPFPLPAAVATPVPTQVDDTTPADARTLYTADDQPILPECPRIVSNAPWNPANDQAPIWIDSDGRWHGWMLQHSEDLRRDPRYIQWMKEHP